MLPENIDLTEHRDFGSGLFGLLPVDGRPVRGDFTPPSVRLGLWEDIFGKERHTDQRRDIFDPDYNLRPVTECFRCGAELRIPWDRLHGLCKECKSKLVSLKTDNNRTPWKSPISVRDTTKDIFNLR